MQIFPTKRFWKRLAIGAAILVAIALIANGFMAWLTEHRLQTRIAAIRAAGDPASIADLAPKPIPDDQNAAYYLERIKPQLLAFNKENAHFYDSPLGKEYDDDDRAPTPTQIDAIREIIDKYPEIDRGLAAAACNEYASNSDFSVNQTQFLDAILENQKTIRAAARFLQWRIEVLTAEHRPEEAVQCGIEMLRLARLWESEPGLVSFLVSIAVRGIAVQALYEPLTLGPISSESRKNLDAELARQDDSQGIVGALKRERALGFATIEQFVGQVKPALWVSMVGWPMKSFYLGAIDLYDEQLQLAGRSWYEIQDRLGPRNKATGAWNSQPAATGYGVLADLLLPSLRAAYDANSRNLAMLRALRILNALQQYEDQNGHEARGLEDLSLPKEATIDPFSGQPLKLKHTADGWIIYTVMRNGVDDGGDFTGLKDFGLAPRGYRSTEKHEEASEDAASAPNQ